MASITVLIRRLAASPVALTLTFLIVLNAIIVQTLNLCGLSSKSFTVLSRNPTVSKLPTFLDSHNNPDVLILGSSLVLRPAVRCDDELEGRRTRYDGWYLRNYISEYSHANYFQRLLSEKIGVRLSLTNLGVAAGMMSDQCLIFEKILASGKTPQLVLLCLAPRDFLDNYRSDPEKTLVYQVLSDQSLEDLLARKATFLEMADLILCKVWHFYKARTYYRTCFSAWTESVIGPLLTYSQTLFRTKTTFASQETHTVRKEVNSGNPSMTEVMPNYIPEPNVMPDLDIYRRMYNPPNFQLFKSQSVYLERMLKRAQNSGVMVVLVNMPIAEQNKQLLAPQLHRSYHALIACMSCKYGCTYINLDSLNLTIKEFEDSCHMNARGAKKFYGALIGALESNSSIFSHLHHKDRLSGDSIMR